MYVHARSLKFCEAESNGQWDYEVIVYDPETKREKRELVSGGIQIVDAVAKRLGRDLLLLR